MIGPAANFAAPPALSLDRCRKCLRPRPRHRRARQPAGPDEPVELVRRDRVVPAEHLLEASRLQPAARCILPRAVAEAFDRRRGFELLNLSAIH